MPKWAFECATTCVSKRHFDDKNQYSEKINCVEKFDVFIGYNI